MRALPTFALLLLLLFYLKAMFFKPLEKALAERKAATAGVRKLAEESLAKAEQKAAEYDQSLRNARVEIYKEQEALRAQWREEQAKAMKEVRATTDAALREAQQQLDAHKQTALASLDAESDALAEQITRRVLAGGAN